MTWNDQRCRCQSEWTQNLPWLQWLNTAADCPVARPCCHPHNTTQQSTVYPDSLLTKHTRTHTHTRLTALCPGIPGWAGTRKVKPIWILLKQETVSGRQWHPLGHMQVWTSLQTDNHASTPPLSFFTGRMPFLPPNQQRQSTEGIRNSTENSALCNSLLYGLPDTLLHKLKSAQNATAWLITGTQRSDHILLELRELHWLPIRERVKFKVACQVRQSLSGQAPLYLADDCRLVSDSTRRSLWSADVSTCMVPPTLSSYGDITFAAAGPRLWNSLPVQLRNLDITYGLFQQQLEGHLFREA